MISLGLTSSVSEIDLAYMAGIIDGEGSICVFEYLASPHQKNGVRYKRYKTSISVSNTSTDLMDWIVARFGSRYREARRITPRWKPCYHWDVAHSRACRLAQVLLPYLVIKREQAELLISFHSTGQYFGRHGLSQDILNYRTDIFSKVSALNKRGPDAMVA